MIFRTMSTFTFSLLSIIAKSQTVDFYGVRTSIAPIVTSDETTVVALNDSASDDKARIVGLRKDGSEKWLVEIERTRITSMSSLTQEVILVAGRASYEERGVVYAISQNGKLKWKLKLDAFYYPDSKSIVGADNKIRLIANSKVGAGVMVYFIDLESGRVEK